MLLMDEPFGALDALTRHQMQELLTQIWEEHRLTVLFVTHDVEEAVYLSDRIVVMGIGPGRITQTFNVDIERPRREEVMETPGLHGSAARRAQGDPRSVKTSRNGVAPGTQLLLTQWEPC